MITLTAYLDTRNKNAIDFPLTIRLTANRTSTYIPTNIKIRQEQWQNRCIICHRQAKLLNKVLNEQIARLRLNLAELSNTTDLQRLTASEIRKLLLGEQPTKQQHSFNDYAERYISTKKAVKTKETYYYTLKALSHFTDGRKLLLNEISISFIRQFEAWLQQSCKTNTISIHLRNIRAILNGAIDDDLLPQEAYPFRRFKIKTAPTMKRSLNVEQVRRLMAYPCNKTQCKYRDIFILSLFLAGINMIPMIICLHNILTALSYCYAKQMQRLLLIGERYMSSIPAMA